MTTWARVEASRHDHTASHHLMQAPTSQLVRKRVETCGRSLGRS